MRRVFESKPWAIWAMSSSVQKDRITGLRVVSAID